MEGIIIASCELKVGDIGILIVRNTPILITDISADPGTVSDIGWY